MTSVIPELTLVDDLRTLQLAENDEARPKAVPADQPRTPRNSKAGGSSCASPSRRRPEPIPIFDDDGSTNPQ